MKSADVVERHRAAGRFFDAAGVKSFVRDEGSGDAVVCIHGVPTSSFLYRKVVAELFHLVVHDIGGPVGFELAAAMPDRIRSLTLLNTIVEVDTFKRPWSMEPFARRRLGEVYLATLTKPAFRQLMNLQGIGDRAATPKEEIYAYVDCSSARMAAAPSSRSCAASSGRPRSVGCTRASCATSPTPCRSCGAQTIRRSSSRCTASRHGGPPASTRSTASPRSTSFKRTRRPAIAERVAALADRS